MKIKKTIRAGLIRGIISLPEEITDDTLLELTVQEALPEKTPDNRRGCQELKELFESRIRAAAPELNFTEEVFALDEVQWQDLNEVKAHFEGQGYGVKMDQENNRIRFKILWRYV